ncbi:MAG: hypothetical protein HWN66_19545 [Candidatus Helarchaeota archaeon]|nr:hypothetical protein [Candidatus Helarchaeota archaeon]
MGKIGDGNVMTVTNKRIGGIIILIFSCIYLFGENGSLIVTWGIMPGPESILLIITYLLLGTGFGLALIGGIMLIRDNPGSKLSLMGGIVLACWGYFLLFVNIVSMLAGGPPPPDVALPYIRELVINVTFVPAMLIVGASVGMRMDE